MPSNPRPSPKQVALAQLAQRAAALRRSGLGVDAIAEVLQVSRSTAKRLLKREAERQQRDTRDIAACALTTALSRCDAVLAMNFAVLQNPNATAADKARAGRVILRAVELQAKLQGLMEQRVHVHTDEKPTLAPPKRHSDEEISRRVIELLAKGEAV